MKIQLIVTEGPHVGKEFSFEGSDTFLVGRSRDAHFRLSRDDPYFSRRHFLVEVKPPRCRLLDLDSHNHTYVNGSQVAEAELRDGDEIKAGHTILRMHVLEDAPEDSLLTNAPAATPRPSNDSPSQVTQTLSPSAAALPAPADAPNIPGLRIEEELGRGGMGVVYRAVRESDGTSVAVKTIRPVGGVTQKAVDRFLREAKILRELEHPHIVRYAESGEVGGMLYFVMELVIGTDAGRMLRDSGPLSIRSAVRLVCQMLRALEFAHGKGFVHRDIKPCNVLIEGEGRKRSVKVADFGLARAYQASPVSGLTLPGEVGGTVPFMSPEQVTHFREVKPAADQYSAAATLYNLLSGRFPHDLPVPIAKQLVHIVTQPPVPIRQRREDIPAALADVIHRALAREPEDRFPDVCAFYDALTPFVQ